MRLKKTIREAAIEALKLKGKPLSAKEIYDYIIEKDLYRFNAEHPESIVKTEIRRHCEGVEFPTAKPQQVFPNTQRWNLLDKRYSCAWTIQ